MTERLTDYINKPTNFTNHDAFVSISTVLWRSLVNIFKTLKIPGMPFK